MIEGRHETGPEPETKDEPRPEMISTRVKEAQNFFYGLCRFPESGKSSLDRWGTQYGYLVSFDLHRPYPEEHGEECGGKVLLLTDEILTFAQENKEKILDAVHRLESMGNRVPNVISSLLRISEPKTRYVLHRLSVNMIPISDVLRYVEAIEMFEESFISKHADDVCSFVNMSALDDQDDYVRLLACGDKKITLESFKEGWPPDLFNLMRRRGLSLVEIFLIKLKLYRAMRSRRFVTHPPFSRTTIEFLSEEWRRLTSETVNAVLNLRDEKATRLSQRWIFEALVAGCDSTDVRRFIQLSGETKPIVILNNFRDYRSCSMTEDRLLQELYDKRCAIARFLRHDGAEMLMAFKYEEVTVGVCLSSSLPEFSPWMSYIPVGETLGWSHALPAGKITPVGLDEGREGAAAYVFFKNRKMSLNQTLLDQGWRGDVMRLANEYAP